MLRVVGPEDTVSDASAAGSEGSNGFDAAANGRVPGRRRMSKQITFSVPADEFIRDFVDSGDGTPGSDMPTTHDTPEPAANGHTSEAVPADEADSYIEELLSRQPHPAAGPPALAGSAGQTWCPARPRRRRRPIRRLAVVAAALCASAGTLVAMVAAEGAPAAHRGQRATLARSDTSTVNALSNLPNSVTRAAATDLAGLLHRIDASAGHRRGAHASDARAKRARRHHRVTAPMHGATGATPSQPTTPTESPQPVDTSPASASTTPPSRASSTEQSSGPRPAFGENGILGPGHSPSG